MVKISCSQLNALFLVKLFQRVKRLSSLQRHLLNFLKNRVSSSFSPFYTFGEFLTKSLNITHLICLNLLLVTGKAFQRTWLVEHRLWCSFTIHWNILCRAIHVLVYLLLEGNRSWTCFDACTFYPHITVTRVCAH